jgi:hypothetical protein
MFMKDLDSYIQELKSSAKFTQLLSPWINFIVPVLLSCAVGFWCLPLVKSASNLELILFEIGIGSSVGIITNMILYGILCVWHQSCQHHRIYTILDSHSNIWMSLMYGFGNLLGFYFWSGAYIAIINGGSSGAIGGIICAIGSIVIKSVV